MTVATHRSVAIREVRRPPPEVNAIWSGPVRFAALRGADHRCLVTALSVDQTADVPVVEKDRVDEREDAVNVVEEVVVLTYRTLVGHRCPVPCGGGD